MTKQDKKFLLILTMAIITAMGPQEWVRLIGIVVLLLLAFAGTQNK